MFKTKNSKQICNTLLIPLISLCLLIKTFKLNAFAEESTSTTQLIENIINKKPSDGLTIIIILAIFTITFVCTALYTYKLKRKINNAKLNDTPPISKSDEESNDENIT